MINQEHHTSIAKAKNIRLAPRKASLMAKQIRGKNVELAVAYLSNLNNKSAFILKKLLISAIANATDLDKTVKVNQLYIDQIFVTKGTTLKRMRPRAMGRGFLIKKRLSHITVSLNNLSK